MFEKLKVKAAAFGAKTGAKIIKHSPEILFGIGCVTFVGTVIFAVKTAPKIEEALSDHNEEKKLIENEKSSYTTSEYRSEVCKLYKNTFFRIVKLSAPVGALGMVSLGCFGGAQYIVLRRLGALSSEYIMLDNAFKSYRQNVVEEEGKEKDWHYLYSTKEETKTVPILDEEGNTEEKEVTETVASDPGVGFIVSKETVKTGWFTGIDKCDESLIEGILKVLHQKFEKKMMLTRADVLMQFGLKDELKRQKDTAWMFGKIRENDNDKLSFSVSRASLPDYEKSSGDRVFYHIIWNNEENLLGKI